MTETQSNNEIETRDKWFWMACECPGQIRLFGTDPGLFCKLVRDWCNIDNCIMHYWRKD